MQLKGCFHYELSLCSPFIMAKKGKGGKNKRKARNNAFFKRELIFKEEGQEYAQVLRMLGNGRVEAYCFDGVKRLCTIRGQMRRRVWINAEDIVLLGLREYQDEKADIILKYTSNEVRSLKTYGELPESLKHNEDDDDDDIQFYKGGDSEEDEEEKKLEKDEIELI